MPTDQQAISTSSVEQAGFEAQAAGVLARLRGAFGAIMDALPGGVIRPHELQKSLKINKRLAWKIARFVHEEDVFSSVEHLCGPSGIEIFLDAAARRNIAAELIDTARRAVASYDRLVDVHAGERGALELMLRACSTKGRTEMAREQRKAAFGPNSFIWGVQAKTQLSAFFAYPSAQPDKLDWAVVRGFVNFRRVRPNVSWVFSRVRCFDDHGNLYSHMPLEALDPNFSSDARHFTTPLLGEFCSQPLPPVRRVRGTAGFLEDELLPTAVGNTGAITCIAGEVARAVFDAYRREGGDEWAALHVPVRTPVEMLVIDRFVHQDVYRDLCPELIVRSELNGPLLLPPDQLHDRDELEVGEEIQYLGKDPAAAYTPYVPRYQELVDGVCRRLGWKREALVLYRVKIPYPPMPASVNLRHRLPERPQAERV